MFRNLSIFFLFFALFLQLSAAEVTEVADAFDPENPFDFNLDIGFVNMHHFSRIKREYNSGLGNPYEASDGSLYYTTDGRRVETLEYSGDAATRYTGTLLIEAEIGLFKDLSLSVDIPVVLKDEFTLSLENISDESNPHTLATDGYFPTNEKLSYNHKGVGDIAIGIQWAPYNQYRKKDAFSLLTGFKVTFPTAEIASPEGMNVRTSSGAIIRSGKEGKVGKGLFVFHLRTAVSKRYSVAEPYMQFEASFPVKSSNSIYEKIRNTYNVNIGTEFIAWERNESNQKVVFTTDLGLRYVTRGSSYNSITDARWVYDDNLPPGGYTSANADKALLPIEDGYLDAMFTFKSSFKVARYVSFGAYGSVGYRQKHYLTDAVKGEAGYIAGLDDSDTSHLKPKEGDPNPAFEGGKLIDERHILVGWGVNLSLMF